MYCIFCGNEMPDTAVFCNRCGVQIRQPECSAETEVTKQSVVTSETESMNQLTMSNQEGEPLQIPNPYALQGQDIMMGFATLKKPRKTHRALSILLSIAFFLVLLCMSCVVTMRKTVSKRNIEKVVNDVPLTSFIDADQIVEEYDYQCQKYIEGTYGSHSYLIDYPSLESEPVRRMICDIETTEWITEKVNKYVDFLLYDKGIASIEPEEVTELMDSLLEKHVGETLPSEVYRNIEKDLLYEGIREYDGVRIYHDHYDLIHKIRIPFSQGIFVVSIIVLTLLVIGVILLNVYRLKSSFLYIGIPNLLVGILFLMSSFLTKYVRSMFDEEEMLNTLIDVVANNVKTLIFARGLILVGIGTVLVVISVIISKCNKRKY